MIYYYISVLVLDYERLLAHASIHTTKAFNAFVVWMEVNPGWNRERTVKGRLFLEEQGEALVTPLVERCQPFPQTPSSAR